MHIRQLEYFLSVCDTLNFTKAASRFYISQTAVSLQIKSLEEELGVSLFKRTKHHVEITPAGRIFQEECRAILTRLESAVEKTRNESAKVAGTLKIGYVMGIEKTDIPDFLQQFHSSYANISIELYRGTRVDLYEKVLQEQIDVAVNLRHDGEHPAGIQTADLCTHPLKALLHISHPLSYKALVTPSDLGPYPLISVQNAGESIYDEQWVFEKFFQAVGYEPKVIYASEELENIALLVCAGMGYALLPGYFADASVRDRKMTALPIKGYEQAINIVIAKKEGTEDPLANIFYDYAVSYLHRYL